MRSIGVRGGGDDDGDGWWWWCLFAVLGVFASIRASLILYDGFLLLLYCCYFVFTVPIAW